MRRRQGTAGPDGGARERETLLRVVTTLRQLQRHGIAAIPVADVLVMLGAAPEAEPAARPAHDPVGDPLTGCRSVLPG